MFGGWFPSKIDVSWFIWHPPSAIDLFWPSCKHEPLIIGLTFHFSAFLVHGRLNEELAFWKRTGHCGKCEKLKQKMTQIFFVDFASALGGWSAWESVWYGICHTSPELVKFYKHEPKDESGFH
jgi:hypothetical protein